ncbi:MAG: hypothetical protein C4318_06615 [Acidimicrobiia bacterium]
MIFILVGFHIVLASFAPIIYRLVKRHIVFVAASAPAVTVIWAAFFAPRIVAGQPYIENLDFAPSLGFQLSFRADAFALLMCFVTSTLGVLLFAYSYFYFYRFEEDLARFTGWMLVFGGSMLGLVFSDNLIELFTFWELTTIASYMLIGFYDQKEAARAGALQALLMTGLGSLVMLAGFVMVGEAAGSYSISEILRSAPRGPLVEVAAGCILIGAFTKSAQVPFHSWLSSAMVAPTPASAYLHAASMVKAGVFLIGRLSPALATTGLWRPSCLLGRNSDNVHRRLQGSAPVRLKTAACLRDY